jgi:methionine sulfoxide reductase heme-binding subunit
MTTWYVTRSTGAAALVLLTLTLVLGVVDVTRWSTPRLPRFVVDGLHRTVALLVVAFVAIHVITSVIDSFAPIRLTDAVIPFGSSYRPLWVGLGAIALDLLLAIIATSLLRARLGVRAWRTVHWLSYASWPVALMHGLGTGSDVRAGWMLWLSIACVAAVAVAILGRAAAAVPRRNALLGAGATVAGSAIALAAWVPGGPLKKDWARRAGTPSPLLSSGHTASTTRGGHR